MAQPTVTSVPGFLGNFDDTIALTLAATQSAGDIIICGDRVGVVASIPAGVVAPAPIGTIVPVRIRGLLNNMPKLAGQAWVQGDDIWYDPTGNAGAGTFQNTPARFRVGTAPNTQLSGDVTASVLFTDTDDTIMAIQQGVVASPANSGAEQVVANLKIPAGTLRVGTRFKIKGTLHETGENATDTLAVKIRIGDVDGLTGAASTTLASVAATTGGVGKIVDFDLEALVTAIGASGTIEVRGPVTNLAASGTAAPVAQTAYAAALDTTKDQYVAVTQLFSSANAADTTEVRPGFCLERNR